MITITGGCLCGEVRYTGEIDKKTVVQCHCKNCQKHSGSAFSINLIVPMDKFQIDKSLLTNYRDEGDNGKPVHRYNCAKCGSVMMSGNTDLTGVGILKVGTLDNASDITPQVSLWEKSAQPWVQQCENVAHFDTQP